MPAVRPEYRPLDPEACQALAAALGDSPETVISVHLLRRGLGRAWAAGDPAHFTAAIVQDSACPAEPAAFGADPDLLWDLLQAVPGWECVEASSACAARLGELFQEHTGRGVRYYGDVFHVLVASHTSSAGWDARARRRAGAQQNSCGGPLVQPAPDWPHPAVRQLTLPDLPLLEAARVGGLGFGGPRDLLQGGFAAAALVEGQIVAIAQTYARSERHADIGVFTQEAWRRRGFATATAAIVARRVQEAGQVPVWSAGEGNDASLGLARKLGFVEVSRRTYLIPER